MARRVWHLLKPNHANETVHQAIWFDTETDQRDAGDGITEHVLRFGWACYRKRNRHGNWSQPVWLRFTAVSEFWDFVESRVRPKTRCWMFCHNTNFDLPVLASLTALPARGWECTTAIIDGPPTLMVYRKGQRTLSICDTLNIWRMSLAQLGKHVHFPKLRMPRPDQSRARWDAYGRRDVKVIMRACMEWWRWLIDNDFGGFAPTLASQAMRAFRHRYMRHEILIDAHPQALDLARDAYHGGRVECGFIGDQHGHFVLADVNSMYPYVMWANEMPAKLAGWYPRPTVAQLEAYLRTHCVVAEVRLFTDQAFACVMRDHKLIFPVGNFTTTLTTPELLYALQHGYLVSVNRMAVYTRQPLFREFVESLYDLRRAAIEAHNETSAWQYKILLNSFYGKWGQSGRKWRNIGTCDPAIIDNLFEIDAPTGEVTTIRKFGGVVQRLEMDGESFESHPAIAAHITAYARMELFEIILQAGIENYLYCDTDAVLVTLQGFERLKDRIDRVGLGKLKLVGTYNHVSIRGLKDYTLDGKQTLKGIRPSARQINDCTYEQERWSWLKGLIREHSINAPRTRLIVKRLSRVYSKGTVLPSGRTAPFLLAEW